MNEKIVAALRTFSLDARHLLEKEVGDQLEGVYGLLPDGLFAPADKYPAVHKLSEAKETRGRLERFMVDEAAAGLPTFDSRKKLLREASFTWINRLVAFRMMETRKLLRRVISKPEDSNAFKLWLTEEVNADDLKKYEEGDLPQNDLGEGPRQEAYRHFILWQCGELAKELRVLFDPETLPSRLFPRPRTLAEIIEMMNSPELEEAWQPGNEETIGWIYQFFNSEELEKSFQKVRESKKKFEAADIPSVTQLFTPHWIVRYLVENTLGRLWLDMHPDSSLADKLEYLVPLEGSRGVQQKPVKEISLLDPACGSMHFGLMAFDLFVEMYREELEKSGSKGWPETSSVEREEDIPASIIANNIAGIDLDFRAVQLSSLTLYLKAKFLNPEAEIKESMLACADVHMLGGERMDKFIAEAKLDRPVYKRILPALQESLRNSEQLGSLLRLEEEIGMLISKEKDHYERRGRQLSLPGWQGALQAEFPGWPEAQFEDEAGQSEFWDILEIQIKQALDHFASSHGGEGFFAGEVRKGLRCLDVVSKKYDVVVTNPPYLSNRKMNSRLKDLLKEQYKEGKQDFYAAFLKRCTELTAKEGRVGMLTMHSFMFISSYKGLRNWMRERIVIDTMAHFGPALFAVGNPGTLQTTAGIYRLEDDDKKRNDSEGTYFRLVKEPDSERKRRRFEEAVVKLRSGEDDPIIYHYKQRDFDAIPGNPWVYWMPQHLVELFERFKKIEQVAKPRQGLATADNTRFLRMWWEVGVDKIGFKYKNCREAKETGNKWFPYMKGGTPVPWFGNQNCVLNWFDNGKEIYAFRPRSVVRNPTYYFRKGVTWSDVSSKGFAARLSPGGFIHDVKGMTCFLQEEGIFFILGLLNSSFARFIVSALNPTISYQVGDIERLPVPSQHSDIIDELVSRCVELTRQESWESEVTYDFIVPVQDNNELFRRKVELAALEVKIDQEVSRLYGLTDEDIAHIDRELTGEVIADEGDEEGDIEVSEEDSEDKIPEGLSPQKWASSWLSYAVGIVLSRFQPGVGVALGRGNFSDEVNKELQALADPDGIMVMDEGHSDDLPARVLECITVILGQDEVANVVKTATGKDGPPEELLRNYLDKNFFKQHIQLYRKRPVYWFFQSPKKKYGVWVFHERMTKDTLFRIRTEYVEPKTRLLESQLGDLKNKSTATDGRELRLLEKEISDLSDLLDDVAEFAKLIRKVTDKGYKHHIDDGVLINLAPLWELMPSWQTEPKKAWEKLENGDWDWSYQAMDHWPERVREECKKNKSYAIAHGLESLYEG